MTFTAWVKGYQIPANICNARVAGIGKFLSSENFWLYGMHNVIPSTSLLDTVTTKSQSVNTKKNSMLEAQTSNDTPMSGMNKALNEDQHQGVVIGMSVTALVLGVTQALIILAVVLLTVAIIKIHKMHKKDVKEPPPLQMKTNNAYGVRQASSQQVYDYI